MDEPNGIIALIGQLSALVAERGMPKDGAQIPKGIVASPEGSSFKTDNKLSPILSPVEKSRVKQIAEIFKAVLNPGPEARKTVATNSETSSRKSSTDDAKIQVGVDEKSSGVLGILGSILGIGGGAGGALAIAASALPILATVTGAAAAIYAAGPTSKMFAEALVLLSTANWDGLDRATANAGKIADIGMKFIGFLHNKGMQTIEGFFEISRKNMTAFAGTMGILATNIKQFENVEWNDVIKAFSSMGAMMGILAVSGVPIVAAFEALGALVLTLGGKALLTVGRGISGLSAGMGDLFKVLDEYKSLPIDALANGFKSIITVMTTVGVAGVGAPLLALGAFASQMVGVGLTDLSVGLASLGKALPYLTSGLMGLQNVDGDKLTQASVGIRGIGNAMLVFTAGTVSSTLANMFSTIFGGDGFAKFLSLASNADKLKISASSIVHLKNAFKEFTDLPIGKLADNLESIVDAVDNLNISKLKQIYTTPGGIMSNTATFQMKAISKYLLYGEDGSKSGIIRVTSDLLSVNNDQLKTLKEMKGVLLEIRAKIPVDIQVSSNKSAAPSASRGGKVNNFRDDLRALTIQPLYK